MEGDEIGSGRAKVVDVALGFDDHQVNVEGKLRKPAQIADDFWPPGQVRNEAAVHDVEVQIVGATRLDQRDLFRDSGEVRGQERWSQLDHGVPFADRAVAAACGSTPRTFELNSSLLM